MNTHVPEEYGGPGASYLDGCIIEEELSWGCSGITTSLGANGLASAPLALAGSDELKKQYLGMLTEDFKLASFCLTEPDAGSDVSGMRTTAVRKGDKYVLNGSKCFITNGGYADWFTVYAKTDKDAGHRGISCFLVPKDDTVTVDKKEDKMGQRASNTATITFNETEIPADHLIGEENKGFKIAMMTLDRTRPGVAAMATGIARAAFEFATSYSKERVQFGVPIAMHQAIQFMIADMATKVHLSRLATWNSAVLLDQGRRNTLESSHAKRFAADTAMEVATDAVQVYGGYGFIKEYPVEKLMRDAKIMQLYEGTSQIQRLVIARETLLPRRIEEPAAAVTAAFRPSLRGRTRHRRAAHRRADAASATGLEAARAAVDAAGRPARGPGSGDPLIGDLRRAGLLPLLVLHFAAREPAYGNQLIERIEALTGGALHVNPNTMYPLLRSLEAQGLVAGEWEHPERRSRRFYRATDDGPEELRRLSGELGPAAGPHRRLDRRDPRGARAADGARQGVDLRAREGRRRRGALVRPAPLAGVDRRLRPRRLARRRLAPPRRRARLGVPAGRPRARDRARGRLRDAPRARRSRSRTPR